MGVISDVQRDAVVVDGIMNLPVPAGIAVAEIGLTANLPLETSVQAVGNRDPQAHILDLVAQLFLVSATRSGPGALAGRGDPGPSGRVGGEGNPAPAPLARRLSGKIEVDGGRLVLLQSSGKINETSADYPGVRQLPAAADDLLDLQFRFQVELDAGVVLEHLETDRVLSAPRPGCWIDPKIEIVGEKIIVRPVGAVAPLRASAPGSGFGRIGRCCGGFGLFWGGGAWAERTAREAAAPRARTIHALGRGEGGICVRSSFASWPPYRSIYSVSGRREKLSYACFFSSVNADSIFLEKPNLGNG